MAVIPQTGEFTLISMSGSVARADHTATLLTDGRVLIVGGTRGGPGPVASELWDVTARTATPVQAPGLDRRGHRASLMADGRVLVTAGTAADGAAVRDAVALDPATGRLTPVPSNPGRPTAVLTASIPVAGAEDVSIDAHLTLRFSAALTIDSVTSQTFNLVGPDGAVAVRMVPAEEGRLVFLWPLERLAEETTYVLTVSGVTDATGHPVAPASIPFSTERIGDSAATRDADQEWHPDPASGWRTNRASSTWQALKPLQAPPGVTAVAGQVLTLDGEPLAGVRLEIDKRVTHTDRTGRFLLRLDGMATGHVELWIDGTPATRRRVTYGTYEVGVDLQGGRTLALPYTIWMTRLDTAHALTIPSPTVTETIVTTPWIPGLELHIPPGAVIRDHEGKPVTTLSITPIPLDRPPFPLPAGVHVPVYFTIQPGGAYVFTATASHSGARLIYPNGFHLPAATIFDFWHYSPDRAGWWVYGHGRATADARQVVPDPGVEIYEFTGAMAAPPGLGPPNGDPPGNDDDGGDPVSLYTGLFVLRKTDLSVRDVLHVALTRTYRPADTRSRAFGIGATHPYDQFLIGDTFPYTYLELVLTDGGRVHYDRTSPGTGYQDAVYQHVQTPTDWQQSTIAWNGAGWTLTKTDGTVLKFRDGFNAVRPQQAALTEIRDRYGNTITLTRDADANLTQIRTTNGRFIKLTYDTSYRVTQAQDNIGRTVGYTYDASGRLWKVTDPEGGVTEYTYDASHRMTTITDARGIMYLTNEYDTSDRVTRQVLPDGEYLFEYSVDGQGNNVTDVTNPRGYVARMTFNTAGYNTSRIDAVGTAVERTTTTTRATGTNLVTAIVDGLNRRTEYTYDGHGHVASVTRLAGTANAVTTNYTYEQHFFQLATITDPLQHTWTVTYDASGHLSGVTDPLNHHTTIALNAAGQAISVSDPLSHQWQFSYKDGDWIATTNPLNQPTTRFVDRAGRVVATTDPLGRMTRTTFDNLNRITTVTDPLGRQTQFTYDGNSNLTALTDALTHVTGYAYDTSDRVATRTDPLTHAATYQYDGNGNVTQTTDRKGQVTTRTYDALDRLAQVTFDDASTITYTYDAGDRLLEIDDSANGTITRSYDDLDRLTEEATADGTVSYTYDAAGRRATMTVAGQTAVEYAYDDADRLTGITQGSDVVGFTYDDANRRSTLEYPNGIVATYGYDAANQLTSLTYTLGGNTLGDLTYNYDPAGQRTSVGGSWARTGIPAEMTSATYDAANRIVSWDGMSFSYDPNGNLSTDGAKTYSWNARDQLVSVGGTIASNYSYNGLGRRRSKSINGSITRFLYDGLNRVQDLSAGGTPTVNLMAGNLDEVRERADAIGSSALITDASGSAIGLADATGVLQTSYTYTPFGQTTTTGAASSNDVRYTGRENDFGDLYYYRARYYDSRVQRFISEDPTDFDGGMNLYAYTENDPINYVDPLGLKPNPIPGQPPPRRGRPAPPGSNPPRPPSTPPKKPGDPNPPGKDKPGKDKPEKPNRCDPNCVGNCRTNLVICLSGVAAGLGTIVGGAALTCGLAGVVGGPAAIVTCLELMEPGITIAETELAIGGVAGCILAYEKGIARCHACTQ